MVEEVEGLRAELQGDALGNGGVLGYGKVDILKPGRRQDIPARIAKDAGRGKNKSSLIQPLPRRGVG